MRRKSLVRSLFKGLDRISLAFILALLSSQTNQTFNDIRNYLDKPPLMEEFEEQTGISLRAWDDEIEENKRTISHYATAIDRERTTRDFDLTRIRIESPKHFRNGFLENFSRVFFQEYAGYCARDFIGLETRASTETLHHEIKHAKTFDIKREHPEFLERWKALSVDSQGNSIYYTNSEYIFSRINGLEGLVDKEKKISHINEDLGFVSNYARTNVLEDIAELGRLAETNIQAFRGWLFGDENERNQTIIDKVNLAQEYGIIAPEFTEAVRISKMYWDLLGFRGSISVSRSRPFIEDSERFLEENPGSVYESEIRYVRARIFREGSVPWYKEAYGIDYTMDDAIGEYMRILSSEYKDPVPYLSTLDELADIYWNNGNGQDDLNAIFGSAHRIYLERALEGYMDLGSNGVNDYLISRGIDLPNDE